MKSKYNEMIPKDAIRIINALEAKGYEAYVVGGCVRDMLMAREPNDWDVTTSAKPDEVKEVFKRTYDTGIAHGTVTVILDKEHYEVTTYRVEGDYKDCRHPESVSFVEDLTLDLSRRDFTMNAIAYHPERGFVDPYKGREDIEAGIIRSVRDAKERFTEDALRILRGVRFAAQLGFELEANTLQGIRECRELLEHISRERIRDEFLKICLSDRPHYINQLKDLELLVYILPEMLPMYNTPQNNPHHCYNVAEHTLVAVAHVPKEVTLRLAALLHDIGKSYTRTTDKHHIDHFYNHAEKSVEITKKVLKDLRLDNQTISDVTKLVKYHDFKLVKPITAIYMKELLGELGEDLFDLLMTLSEADARAQHPDQLAKKLKELDKARALKAEIVAKGECYNLKMLAVTGKDLIAAGVKPGPALGETLQKILTHVLAYPEANTKEQLLALIK